MSEPHVDEKFFTDIDEDLCEKREMIKLCLCVLRTQQGKTFVAINKISDHIEEDERNGKKGVHVVHTMNTLLSNQQFCIRLKELEIKYGKGTICILSSNKLGSYKYVTKDKDNKKIICQYTHVKKFEDLKDLCERGHLIEDAIKNKGRKRYDNDTISPKVIVICSNTKRFEDMKGFLKTIDNEQDRYGFDKAYVYYDELHAYINDTLRSQIMEINKLTIVKSILAMTATPYNIFDKDSELWSKIQIIELDDYTAPDYIGVDDMTWHNKDEYIEPLHTMVGLSEMNKNIQQIVGFVHNVIENHPGILQDNTRTFIPAHKNTVSHDAIRDLIFEKNKGAVVVVINGKDKSLTYFDDSEIKQTEMLISKIKKAKPSDSVSEPLEDPKELCGIMTDMIDRLNLTNRPLVVTGFICVSMGQTLTHPESGSFTSAIFSHLSFSNDELYQLFGRTTGRMRDWVTYVKTQIYCPTITENRIRAWEECCKKMASEAMKGQVVSREDFIQPLEGLGDVGIDAIKNLPKEKKKNNGTRSSNKQNDKAIPVKLVVEDDLLAEIITFCTNTKKLGKNTGPKLHKILCDGIENGRIIVDDLNTINKFDISRRELKGKRMFVSEECNSKEDNRRFKSYNEHFENRTTVSQSGNATTYSIDLAKDEFIHDGYTHPHNVIWVTYRC